MGILDNPTRNVGSDEIRSRGEKDCCDCQKGTERRQGWKQTENEHSRPQENQPDSDERTRTSHTEITALHV